MKKIKDSLLLSTVLLFCAAILFTVLVKTVDVQPVGAAGTDIGFSTVNTAAAEAIGYRESLYDFTNILGYFSFLIVAYFALLGLVQLIRKKSLKKIPAGVLAIGILYVVIAIIYVFFEKAVVNYRPILLEEGPEPSFPSTHTLLVCCIAGSAFIFFRRTLKNSVGRTVLLSFFVALIICMVLLRTLSGVHWLTDILGGLIYSAALLSLFQLIWRQITVLQIPKKRISRRSV